MLDYLGHRVSTLAYLLLYLGVAEAGQVERLPYSELISYVKRESATAEI